MAELTLGLLLKIVGAFVSVFGYFWIRYILMPRVFDHFAKKRPNLPLDSERVLNRDKNPEAIGGPSAS